MPVRWKVSDEDDYALEINGNIMKPQLKGSFTIYAAYRTKKSNPVTVHVI